jgi:hypothetical protein
VPVTLRVNVPVGEALEVATCRVEVPDPPEGGVTGLGRFTVTPRGAAPTHECDRATGALNPPKLAIVMVEVAEVPFATEIVPGDAARAKSGAGPVVVVAVLVLVAKIRVSERVLDIPPPVPVITIP